MGARWYMVLARQGACPTNFRRSRPASLLVEHSRTLLRSALESLALIYLFRWLALREGLQQPLTYGYEERLSIAYFVDHRRTGEGESIGAASEGGGRESSRA